MFEVIRERLPLASYLPRRDRTDTLTPDRHREALIVRGAIMARKKLWTTAFDDFRAACAVEGAGGPLTETERGALRRSLFSKYGVPELLADSDIRANFHRLAMEGPVGVGIALTFSRALVWFIRTSLQTGRVALALRYLALAISAAAAARAGRSSLDAA